MLLKKRYPAVEHTFKVKSKNSRLINYIHPERIGFFPANNNPHRWNINLFLFLASNMKLPTRLTIKTCSMFCYQKPVHMFCSRGRNSYKVRKQKTIKKTNNKAFKDVALKSVICNSYNKIITYVAAVLKPHPTKMLPCTQKVTIKFTRNNIAPNTPAEKFLNLIS